jgi:hypothetical protein
VAVYHSFTYIWLMPEFYIHRKLHSRDQLIPDNELQGRSGVFVVLAEPGAGKTDLLDYLSESHSVPRELASMFVYRPVSHQAALVIDALDEVARIVVAQLSVHA